MNKVVNDFSITVGTKNGSGSSTANNTILRAIFKMGIPVSGKNLFPSNIQGLPTWYTIRVSKDGFIGRREEQEIVIAMNPDSFARDLASVAPGGAFYYADDIKQPITRTDVAIYPMPVKQLVRSDPNVPADFRDLVGNMIYVGVLAEMIGIDLEMINAALDVPFQRQAEADRHELQCRQGRRRVGQGQPRKEGCFLPGAHGQDPRPDHVGRKHGRRHRFHFRRRAVRRLVSDHTRLLPGRGIERLSSHAAQARGWQAYLRRRPGRG